eukprot:5322-Heterococcus_DN1.PRE.1
MNAHRTPSVHQRTENTVAPPSPRPSIKLCHAQKRHYLSDQGSSGNHRPCSHRNNRPCSRRIPVSFESQKESRQLFSRSAISVNSFCCVIATVVYISEVNVAFTLNS